MGEELLTARDVQRELKVSRTHAYYLLHTQIPTVQAGKLLRVRRAALEAWLSARERQGSGSATQATDDVPLALAAGQ